MAQATFNAKIVLTAVSATSDPSKFNVTGLITDAEGVFSGLDAIVGDILILDTGATSPGTVSRYAILNISSQSGSGLTAQIQYSDLEAVIDPTGALYTPGFICRGSSLQNIPWVSAADVQGFPQKLVTFALNIINWQTVDPKLGTGGGSTAKWWVEEYTLTSIMIASKQFSLLHTPIDPSNMDIEIVGGPDLLYGVDYTILSGNILSWAGLALDGGPLSVNDTIEVSYFA